MTKGEAKKRIEKLRSLINRHRFLYHVKDTQEISDSAFDMLKHELFSLEQQYQDLITPDSPTQRVGGKPLDKFRKISHKVPMLSIEDVFTEKELGDWEQYLVRLSGQKQFQYFAELKVDGFAVSLQYKDGVLQTGSTRGNGTVGEDVTQNLKTIESIPLRLQRVQKGEIEVRGEVYMEKKDFERFNEERKKSGEELFANPRNLAAGSIRQLDPKLAASRPLKFLAYDLVIPLLSRFAGSRVARHSQEHELLKSLGFKTDPTARACNSIDEILSYWEFIKKKRDSLPFTIDGVVAVVNENALFSKLGVAGKSPRGIRALKFSGMQATTRVLDIQLQVGRTGAVTPVAMLEPVSLAGVTVSRATLHNQDEIQRLDVRVGDTVIVERAGDVIPKVARVLGELRSGKEKTFRMPSHCFICGTKLVRPEGEAIWRCSNKEGCPAQKRESLYHFVSKKGFNMVGLGPKIIDRLLDEHLIGDAADLFALQEGDLAPVERFAEKSSKNLVAAIQTSRRIPFSRFLVALGIRHVGEETAIALADYFEGVEKIKSAPQEELENIPDVGPVVAQSIAEWFASKENQKLITRLLKAGIQIQVPPKPGLGTPRPGLGGKTFVLTGSLESLTREEAKNRIRMVGGNVSESVSPKTDYVVVGKDPGSKLNDARRLGVRILNKEEFLNLLKT